MFTYKRDTLSGQNTLPPDPPKMEYCGGAAAVREFGFFLNKILYETRKKTHNGY
jgi:hypothetical protein